MAQLQEALTQLQETQLRMLQSEKMATHDPLTELPNRRLLMERLETSLAISQHSHQAIALIFLDLDGFKQVNDTYDHQAGDDLLVEVTQRLQACLRKRDGLFRLGGDEFVILIDQVESTVAMIELAKRLLANLKRPFRIKGHTVTIGGSFGIKVYDGQAEQTVREVLSDADQAMYKAKSRRNCVVLHGEAVFHGVD
jgi:diguanylate cyclase (GGDEF)-like protein